MTMENNSNNNNSLYAELPDEVLATLKQQFSSNPKVVEMVDGILAGRAKIREEERRTQEFEDSLDIFDLPAPPDTVHNVMMLWQEVEEPAGEPEEVTLADGKGGWTTETRQPTVKVFRWVKRVNYAQQVVSGSRSGTGKDGGTRKLAISLSRIAADGKSVEPVGNFRTGKEACKYLGIDPGKSSANFYLQGRGYISRSYEGEQFTVPAA